MSQEELEMNEAMVESFGGVPTQRPLQDHTRQISCQNFLLEDKCELDVEQVEAPAPTPERPRVRHHSGLKKMLKKVIWY